MLRQLSAVALVLVLVSGVVAAPVSYVLNSDNTTVKVSGTKPDGKYEGGFKKVSGDVVIDGDITTAKVVVEIDCDSMYTDNEKLTTDLKSADYFDVKQHPKAKFVSTKVTKLDKGGYQIDGNLTLHGKTRPFNFPAQITASPDGLSLTSAFRMNRQDFGISGKGKIDDEVNVSINVKAKK